MKVLIVEDEQKIASQLQDHLSASGFVAHVESRGEDAHFEGDTGEYDAVILDVGLPEMDGFTILEKWRSAGKNMPVIILTARNSKMEIVRGLEAGADDYIAKPFDMEVVTARLRAQLRRNKGTNSHLLTSGKLTLDTRNSRAMVDGQYVKLTRTEYLMVQYLFMHQGKPVSINELVEHTYEDFDNDSSIVARHIANIRKKLGQDAIRTETNRGYYIP